MCIKDCFLMRKCCAILCDNLLKLNRKYININVKIFRTAVDISSNLMSCGNKYLVMTFIIRTIGG